MKRIQGDAPRPTLFLSYSRRDVGLAGHLSRALAAAGTPYWVDLERIRPGDRWSLAVDEGLRTSDAVVLLASRSSVDSPHCRYELATGITLEKPIILVVVDRMVLPPSLTCYPIVDLRQASDMTRWSELIRAAVRVHSPPNLDLVREVSRLRVPSQLLGLFGLLVVAWLCMILGLGSAFKEAVDVQALGYRARNQEVGAWLLNLQIAGSTILLVVFGWWSSRVLVRRITGRQVIALLTLPSALFILLQSWALFIGAMLILVAGGKVASSDNLAGPWLPGGTWHPPRRKTSNPHSTVQQAVAFTVVNVPADKGFARVVTKALCAKGHIRDDKTDLAIRLVILSNAVDIDWVRSAKGHDTARTLYLLLYAIRQDALTDVGISEYQLVDLRRGGHEQLNALAIDISGLASGVMSAEADTYRPLDEIVLPQVITAITLFLAGVSLVIFSSYSWCAATEAYWGPEGCHGGSGDRYVPWLILMNFLLAATVHARAIPVSVAASSLGILIALSVLSGIGVAGGVYLFFAYAYTFTSAGWLWRHWVAWTKADLLGPRSPMRIAASWFFQWVLIGLTVAALSTMGTWQRF